MGEVVHTTDTRKHFGEQAALFQRQATVAEAIARYEETHNDEKHAHHQRFMEKLFQKQADQLTRAAASDPRAKNHIPVTKQMKGVPWNKIAKAEESKIVAEEAVSFSHVADKIAKDNQKLVLHQDVDALDGALASADALYKSHISPSMLTTAAGYQLMAATAGARGKWFQKHHDNANAKQQAASQAKYTQKSRDVIDKAVRSFTAGQKARKRATEAASAQTARVAMKLSKLADQIITKREVDAASRADQVVSTIQKVHTQYTTAQAAYSQDGCE
jgi:hypothetical protein